MSAFEQLVSGSEQCGQGIYYTACRAVSNGSTRARRHNVMVQHRPSGSAVLDVARNGAPFRVGSAPINSEIYPRSGSLRIIIDAFKKGDELVCSLESAGTQLR